MYAELEGIAAGAQRKHDEVTGEGNSEDYDISLLDIIALNARSEIALGGIGDGCTSLSWAIDDDGERRQILAQNWDWTKDVGKNLVLVSIEKPGKPKIWMVTEVSQFGSCIP